MKKNRIGRSLKFSFWDGIFSSAMTGLTAEYITPYALALKATTSQIGMINAFSNLTSSLVQLKTADLVEKLKSRKRMITFFVLLQALTGIPIILIPFLFKQHAVTALIVLVTLFTSLNAFVLPAWLSLMSDYLPPKKRGSYFGWRNRILGVVTITCMFASGFILYLFRDNPLRGFLVIFSVAFISRLTSWFFLTRQYDPPLKMDPESSFGFWDFIRRARESNFVKFVIFASSFVFGVNLASPYFSVFMLKDLKFNYLIFTALIITVPIVTFLAVSRWGRIADRIGNFKVLRVTALLIASLPLFWIINRNPVFLLLAQVVSGFAWAGFNLCVINFIYDAVSPAKRTRCIAYYNVFSGAAICLGSLAGGYLISCLPSLFGYKLLSLFLISSMMRLAVVVFLAPKVKEVRPVENISAKDLFLNVSGINLLFGERQE